MSDTYLAKENHFISNTFFDTLKRHKAGDRQFLLMQLKGILITPYVLQNEWKDHVVETYSHNQFVKKYVQTIHQWLDFIIIQNEEFSTKKMYRRFKYSWNISTIKTA